MSPTAGELLRKARIERKLSLEKIALSTNVRVKFLQALEDDQPELLPSRAQGRGFIRLFAGEIGIDSQPVLDAFDDLMAPPVKEEPAGTAPRERFKRPLITFISPENKESAMPATPLAAGTAKPSLSPSQAAFQSIGATLRSRRETLGLSYEEVEMQIHIRPAYLKALEEGNLEELPSNLYGRGMLGNYAGFLGLDQEALPVRFADALQMRHAELNPELITGQAAAENGQPRPARQSWKRFLSPDMVIVGGLLVALFGFILWGAAQVIKSSSQAARPTELSISEFLLRTATYEAEQVTGTPSGGQAGLTTAEATVEATPVAGLEATVSAVRGGPVQVVIVARQRAWMRVIADNKPVFTGRVTPGNAYTYTANKQIDLLTGDGSALQVYFNQNDLGILGRTGEVVGLIFTLQGVITPTPMFTATPTLTPMPTMTPTPTATEPTPTITILVP